MTNDLQSAYENGRMDAAREDFAMISAIVHAVGGEVTVSWHDLTVVDGAMMSRFDNPDGSITLKVEVGKE